MLQLGSRLQAAAAVIHTYIGLPAAGGELGIPRGEMSDVHHMVQHVVKDIMHAMIDITLGQPALFDF